MEALNFARARALRGGLGVTFKGGIESILSDFSIVYIIHIFIVSVGQKEGAKMGDWEV